MRPHCTMKAIPPQCLHIFNAASPRSIAINTSSILKRTIRCACTAARCAAHRGPSRENTTRSGASMTASPTIRSLRLNMQCSLIGGSRAATSRHGTGNSRSRSGTRKPESSSESTRWTSESTRTTAHSLWVETKGFETRDWRMVRDEIEVLWLPEHLDYRYEVQK